MAFGMFSAQCSPIAIDFGSSSVKLLQIGAGDKPPLIAAAELPITTTMAANPAELQEHLGRELPKLLRQGRFKGKRVVCSVPCGQTMIQHVQISPSDSPANRDALVKAQLQAQFGWSPGNVVVRAIDVTEVHRDSQPRMETICFAVARETVMNHVQLLGRCKLEVVGVHTEVMAMVRAFEHLHRRKDDENVTTLYIDLGYGGTKVAIGHGSRLVFAKCIQLGGRHLDHLIAETLHCDLAAAKAHRLSHNAALSAEAEAPAAARSGAMSSELPAMLRVGMAAADSPTASGSRSDAAAATVTDRRSGQQPAGLRADITPADPPAPPANMCFDDLLDSIVDELSMCVRYHESLFPGRAINRAIFLGGEARQSGLCRSIARALHMPAQLGDPLSRLLVAGTPVTPGLSLQTAQPGWAVPFGLCTAPTDL